MREWIYGRNPVYEVLRAGRRQAFQLFIAEGAQHKGRLKDILNLVEDRNIPAVWVPRHKLERIHPNHQGVALETSRYGYIALPELLSRAEHADEPPLILILDTLQDPQNLGTLLRTGEIVGVHGVLLPYRRTATITPAVVNASSGACEHLQITQSNLAQAITALKKIGVWVVGLESNPEAQAIEEVDLNRPLAIVVGGEGKGLRSLVRKSCDLLIHLPMRGQVDSLNAAVAGSIALYLSWGARGYR
jgi:23S rRNA (guanosine2251-2'-O)-methyltransferase